MDKDKYSGRWSYRHRLRNSWFGGILLITVGATFLLQNFLNFDILGKLWPVFIILLGLDIIVSQSKGSKP